MTVRALFSMGVNVLGGIYIYIFHSNWSNSSNASGWPRLLFLGAL